MGDTQGPRPWARSLAMASSQLLLSRFVHGSFPFLSSLHSLIKSNVAALVVEFSTIPFFIAVASRLRHSGG